MHLVIEVASLFGRLPALVLVVASTASAAPVALSYEEVVARAREHSPEVRLAATDVERARAGIVAADVWLQENPVLDARAGPRFGSDRIRPGGDVDLSIPLELYGQRGLRQEGAQQAVATAEAAASNAERRAVADALGAWFELLHAQDVLEHAGERAALAGSLLASIRQRKEAGDVGDLDLGLVIIEDARARRAVVAARGDVDQAASRLQALLGLARGDELRPVEHLDQAVARYLIDKEPHAERPDLRASALAVKGAQTGVALEERLAWPAVSFHAGYERDDDEDVALVGASLPLPLFQRNQGAIATANAALRQREAELALTRSRIEVEVDAARRRLVAAREGVAILGADVLPRLEENIALMRRAFDAGERGVADLLLVQRDALEARHDIHDALLELGLAGVSLDAAQGEFR